MGAGHAQGRLHLSEHPLIHCEIPTTRLNGWSWEVEGVNQPKPFVYVSRQNLAALNEKGEVDV